MTLNFSVLLSPSSWAHETEYESVWGRCHEDKATKKQKFFGLLSSRIKPTAFSTKVIFLLPRAAKIRDLSRTDLDEKFVLFGSEQCFE